MSGPGWHGGPYRLQVTLEHRALGAAVDLAEPSPAERWLDIATGTGALLRELARRPSRPRYAVGIDTSVSMLAQARSLPPGWETVRADARQLPFRDQSFDTACVAYLLHTLAAADRTAVLREARRVLKPGGRLVAVTLDVRQARTRRMLGLVPRSVGLRPLDPGPELTTAGFSPLVGRFLHAGWPSRCVLAVRA